MNYLLRILALSSVLIILLSVNVFAAEDETSALISVQLESIAESRGREAAQKMALLTLDVLLPQEAAAIAAPKEDKPMKVSVSGIFAFAAIAVLLVLLGYFVLLKNKKKRESYQGKLTTTNERAKRLSLD